MKKIKYIYFLFILLYLSKCHIIKYPELSMDKKTQIMIGNKCNEVNIVFKSEKNIYPPPFLYIKEKKIYINDLYNKSLKIFSVNGRLIKSVMLNTNNIFMNPFHFVVDNENNYYVENIIVSNQKKIFNIIKLDKNGLIIKKIIEAVGNIETININKYNYLTIIFISSNNKWHIQKYINDKLITESIFTSDTILKKQKDEKHIIKNIFLNKNDNFAILEIDKYIKSLYKETLFYLYDINLKKLKGKIKTKILKNGMLLMIDNNENFYFLKEEKKDYITLQIENIEKKATINKRWNIKYINKYGILLKIMIDNNGNFYQIRSTKKTINILKYK